MLTIIKGEWHDQYILNNKKVKFISTLLDDETIGGDPKELFQNKKRSFFGTGVVGDGFIITHEEADKLIRKETKNEKVIFPYLTGKDLNNELKQLASRKIINFRDWDIQKASNYSHCFKIIKERVKPIRDQNKDKRRREIWWQFSRPTLELYEAIRDNDKVLLHTRVTKTHAFAFVISKQVFSDAVVVFIFSTFYPFSILQSTFHEEWAWKYGSTLKSDRRYSLTDCFENYPFPQSLSADQTNRLEFIGKKYHEFRSQLMNKIQLGLTKTYNLFHSKSLSVEEIIKSSKQPQEVCEEAYKDILILRNLHKQMDETVLKAYGCEDIDLAHDFYEVDYLPENDRVRYTISPDARKEVLKRLLKLNHEIHEQEVKAGLQVKRKSKKKQKADTSGQMKLF